MALPSFAEATQWQDEIVAIHEELFQNAMISVYSGPNLEIISRRGARIQQQRTPSIATESGQQIAKRAFLFEISLDKNDPIIKKDHFIRVHSAERDPNLERYVFTVTNSVNSSEAAVRTIETITELAIAPRIP